MIKTLFKDTALFCKAHFFSMLLILMPIFILIEGTSIIYALNFAHLLNESPITVQVIPILLDFLGYPIYISALILYIASVNAGKALGVKDALRHSLRYYIPMLIVAILTTIGIIFGLILLIIPGLLLLVKWAFTELEVVLNNKTPIEAMKQSWQKTKGYMATLLFGFLFITLITEVSIYIIESVFSHYIFTNIATELIYIPFYMLIATYAFHVYQISTSRQAEELITQE